MDLSMRWLKDYVDLTVQPRDYFEAMTMSGSKVEGWRVEGEKISGVVAGKVLSVVPHPDSDHLVVCQVEVGGGKTVQIVTGAQNVVPGAWVPVALDGASLPGGEIHTSRLRGVESQGMLCSLSELGLTAGDFPYAVEDGIFLLQEPCQAGQDIRQVLGFDDTVFEFEITPNRPDCLSVLGLARETAVTYHKPFCPPEPAVEGESGDIRDLLSVSVENKELCLRYVAKAVKNVKIGPSPRWMRERLRASGVRPINNIVDITNFVMLEYGQPMHAFDINCVQGGQIVVRNAREGETLETLDGVVRHLSPEMLVIADAQKPSAVAGVMGGEDSGIHDQTQVVVFESACFFGPSVRSTARKLGMRTEASSRFEKGLDPENCLPAALRACQLVQMLGAGEVVGGVIDERAPALPARVIGLDAGWINRFVGIDMPREEMVRILTDLGFSVQGDQVEVPSFRMGDVEGKADLAEEIARFYGYDRIGVHQLIGVADGALTGRQKFDRSVVATMLGEGMSEVLTYTFISPKYYDKIGLPAESKLRDSVKILTPLGEDTSIMRATTLPSMMEVLSRNYNNRNAAARLFEIAKEFHPTSPEALPVEKEMLTLGIYGPGEDFFTLKGVVEVLLQRLGIGGVTVQPVTDCPTFHPGRCARLLAEDGAALGIIGQVHPTVCQRYEVEGIALLGALEMDALFAHANTERQYTPTPKYPASARDIALLCDQELPVQSLMQAIRAAAPDILESVELFDVYQGAQVPQGKKSVAFNLVLRAPDHTLVDAEVDAAVQAALQAVAGLGAVLRG